MYGLKDLVDYEAVELAVVGLQNELAVSPEVVVGKQSGICINAKDVPSINVDVVGVVVVVDLGVRDRGQ